MVVQTTEERNFQRNEPKSICQIGFFHSNQKNVFDLSLGLFFTQSRSVNSFIKSRQVATRLAGKL